MVKQKYLNRLNRGVEEWNKWKMQHREIRPLLGRANLSGIDLSGIDLSDTDLSKVNFSHTNLSNANLSGAFIRSANLNKEKKEYAMFQDFSRYHWVLPTYFYKDQTSLLTSI